MLRIFADYAILGFMDKQTSLTINRDIVQLKIEGDVVHLPIDGKVTHLTVNGEVIHLTLNKEKPISFGGYAR